MSLWKNKINFAFKEDAWDKSEIHRGQWETDPVGHEKSHEHLPEDNPSNMLE